MDFSIFRAYDIRGAYGTSITELTAYSIALNFAKLILHQQNNKIYVGRDCRLSSPALFEALCQGLIDGGCEVISVGIVSSPMLYFADCVYKPAASIMITGSHNPKHDNGLKILYNGKSFFGENIIKLRDAVLDSELQYSPQSLNISTQDIYAEYVVRLFEGITINDDLKVVWDPGNGATCEVVKLLVSRLSNQNIIINGVYDGNFPNHHPDPTVPANLEQLRMKVLETGSNLGIAFDGDGDRIGIISEDGSFIYADKLMCLFVQDILIQSPRASFVFDIKSSSVIAKVAQDLGGKAYASKTGHAFVKERISETGAAFGGELSGHLFFKDKYYGYDDAVYAALRLLEILSNSAVGLQAMVAQLPETFATPEMRIRASQKFEVIEKIKKDLQDQGVDFNDLDGIRVENPFGWWLLRASNTEEYIVARAEGFSADGLQRVKHEMNSFLQKYALN